MSAIRTGDFTVCQGSTRAPRGRIPGDLLLTGSDSRRSAVAATVVVAAACCAAVAMVVAAPLSAARGGFLAPFVYELFSPVCHQFANRSFHLAGHPLAVCHRCFGFYVGFTLGLALLPLLRPARDWLLANPRRILLFLAPAGIDWLLPMNTPASRFGTALLAAVPIAFLAREAVEQIVVRRRPGNSPAGTP